MSVVDELSQLVRDTDAAVGRAVVAIGRHGRGTGFVIATEPRGHQRPQPARSHDGGPLR